MSGYIRVDPRDHVWVVDGGNLVNRDAIILPAPVMRGPVVGWALIDTIPAKLTESRWTNVAAQTITLASGPVR